MREDALFCTKCGEKVPEWVQEASGGQQLAEQPLPAIQPPKPAARSAEPPIQQPTASPVKPATGFVSGQAAMRAPSQGVAVPKGKGIELNRNLVIGLVALVAVVAIVTVAILMFLIPARTASDTRQQDASTQAAQTASGSATASGGEQAITSGEDVAPVRASFEAYSWSEIVKIAGAMEQAASKAEALQIAKEYHLVDASGKLTGETNTITLKSGRTVDVQICGIMHDDKADGSGKAALSFITKNSYENHSMNPTDTNSGGWNASEMRKWLNEDVLALFPEDVNPIAVRKRSNNTGVTATASAVTETTDVLFLFTWRELLGNITWGGTNNVVFNAEGQQYQLFSDKGVHDKQTNDPEGILYKYQGDGSSEHSVWWTRSAKPNEGNGFGDFDNGQADAGGSSSLAQGTVFGFCL